MVISSCCIFKQKKQRDKVVYQSVVGSKSIQSMILMVVIVIESKVLNQSAHSASQSKIFCHRTACNAKQYYYPD